MKNRDIERYFREGLSNFEQIPPESSWDPISARLNERRKKRIALLVFRIAAGMAILLSTGLIYRVVTNKEKQPEKQTASMQKQDAMPSHQIPFTQAESSRNQEKKNAAEPLKQTDPNPFRHSVSDQSEIVKEVALLNQDHTIFAGTYVDQKNSGDTGQTKLPVPVLKESLIRHLQGNTTKYAALSVKSSERTLSNVEIIALLLEPENEPVVPVKSGKKWMLGSEIAPLYSYRDLSSENVNSDVINDLNQSEDGVLAYAGGIRIAFSTGKRFSIQSGFYYSRYGQEKNNVEAYMASIAANTYEEAAHVVTVSNSTGTINGTASNNDRIDVAVSNDIGSNPNGIAYKYASLTFNAINQPANQEIMLKQYFDYFELPLIARYKVVDRKMDFSLTGGIITNFLIGNTVKMVNNGKTSDIGETTGINDINYQGSFGVGIEYPVISNFALTIEPRFRYYINPIGKSSSIDVRPFSFGFFAGFNYRF